METIKEKELKLITDQVVSAEILRVEDGYMPRVKIRGKGFVAIEKKRGGERVYTSLERLAYKLKDLGVTKFNVIMN